jgi:hypothetical protein
MNLAASSQGWGEATLKPGSKSARGTMGAPFSDRPPVTGPRYVFSPAITLDQPWMVLHERAHGYHYQFLDDCYNTAEVMAAFRGAMEARRYESVLRINGRDDRAYAATNPMEYFAEASEAFFGTNDFYPYVRSELRRHDPRMYNLLEKLWHEE